MQYFSNIKHDEYYQPTPPEVFADIKACAMKVWQTYDNTYGYVDEKVNAIKDLENVKDNTWYMVAMFDNSNQHKLWDMLSENTKDFIKGVQNA